jgi:hypothetical protein
MNAYLSKGLRAYRGYRSFSKRNKTYRAVNYSLIAIASVYCLLLLFPQILFAHQISHKNFVVYSRQPLPQSISVVLDSAELRLTRSPIYKGDLKERLLLTDSFGLYKFLTVKGNSMGSTIPIIGHSRINKTDLDNDLVFRDGAPPNSRSLSGVIAHETMHNQLVAYLGLYRYMRTPTWKDEGYCEYVAGETTLSFEEGLQRWKENPNDTSRYDYFRYHQMVKYLLDNEHVSVEELFTRNFDEKELSDKTLAAISQ